MKFLANNFSSAQDEIASGQICTIGHEDRVGAVKGPHLVTDDGDADDHDFDGKRTRASRRRRRGTEDARLGREVTSGLWLGSRFSFSRPGPARQEANHMIGRLGQPFLSARIFDSYPETRKTLPGSGVHNRTSDYIQLFDNVLRFINSFRCENSTYIFTHKINIPNSNQRQH